MMHSLKDQVVVDFFTSQWKMKVHYEIKVFLYLNNNFKIKSLIRVKYQVQNLDHL
jgi:hypothetical protein